MENNSVLMRLEDIQPYPDDFVFRVDGLSADEYIKKITEEMSQINFDSIPFDKWDFIVAFSLALLEVAGDFFIADPGINKSLVHQLSDKNTTLGKWMSDIHENIEHDRQPIDYLGKGYGGAFHRGKTFGHDSAPLARLMYGAGSEEDDSQGAKTTKKIYNGVLFARDILMLGFALYQIKTGTFIDCSFTKDGKYEWIVSHVTHKGEEYESCGLLTAVIKLAKHLLADFCSTTSLPIPGFSILTHWPDRDVEAFAMKLYRNGLNMRTLFLGGIPVGLIEIIMRLYMHCRYKDSEYSEDQQLHKLNKLLLICHGITTAVNLGKVIISKNPARLNLILIVRTCYLAWQVIREEMLLTNKALTKEAMGIVKNRVESMQTLILLDKTMYQTEQYDRLILNLQKDLKKNLEKEKLSLAKFDQEFDDIFSQIK